MNEESILVTNIQRMCFHDGPGIRTTVFLKGCNLHCPWCANPENISFKPQTYIDNGILGTYGKEYTHEELIKSLLKDRNFYGEDGGVTFSGGEPLLHMRKLSSVLDSLAQGDISVAIESAMQVPFDVWSDAADKIDYYIIDVKILGQDACREVLGGDATCFMENVRRLYQVGKDMVFRIPLNEEYTLANDNFDRITDFLRLYTDVPVEIFATHRLGAEKYKSLGLECPKWEEIPLAKLEETAGRLRAIGCHVTINAI